MCSRWFVASTPVHVIDHELARLHRELNMLTAFGPMYELIAAEISKLNGCLVELAKQSQNERSVDGSDKQDLAGKGNCS